MADQNPSGDAQPNAAIESEQPLDAAPTGSTATPEVGVIEEEIEGGEIRGEIGAGNWRKDRHDAETARWLTIALTIILVVSVTGHYVTVGFLMVNEQESVVKSLSAVFDQWFPVVTAFFGSAVTFYLTRTKGI